MFYLKALYFFMLNKMILIYLYFKYKDNNIFFPMSCKIIRTYKFEGENRIGSRSELRGSIGYNSYVGRNCKISAKIGRYCCIADDVQTISGRHPTDRFVSMSPSFYSLQKTSGIRFCNKQKYTEYAMINKEYAVEIGNDVCISSGVRILGGVKIGDGVMIGANSVVTKDIAPYSIVAGVPARVIRKRFLQSEIDFLLEFKWWNKKLKWIKDNAKYFDDIEKFIEKNR
ncbi:CatB-related O-acetyltransferase [Photobacterium damselae]|uniref:CatB-related O-acetyltransferase n=1 Tax=Photobacterium damselae TaxID=38293 RepID=UPI0015A015CD|nr:CatB-related O-acetyltransferase [Photobacterium damselae]NVO72623.1 CatB-related O-acetyltransferase [Photobacterium damselae subsp. damselae]